MIDYLLNTNYNLVLMNFDFYSKFIFPKYSWELDMVKESSVLKTGYFGSLFGKSLYVNSSLDKDCLYFPLDIKEYKQVGVKQLETSVFTIFNYTKPNTIDIKLVACEKKTLSNIEKVYLLLNNNYLITEFKDQVDPYIIKDIPELIGDYDVFV